MKTIKKIFFYLFTFIFYLGFVQAQPVKKDFTFYRGDYIKLTFQVNGNVTSYNLLFAIKLTKSFTSPRLIQKTNAIASQISATYTAPFTKIDVYLLPEDTRDLTSKVYYYDLVKINPAYSTDETTLFTGEFKNDADVITPFDGTALPTDGTRITTVSLDNGTAPGDIAVWDTSLTRWQPVSRDSIWSFLNVGDTVRNFFKQYSAYAITVLNPITAQDFVLEYVTRSYRIDSIFAVVKDSSVGYKLSYSAEINGVLTDLFSTQTITNNAAGTWTNFISAVIPNNKFLHFLIMSNAGSVNEYLVIKIFFTIT